MKKFKKNSVLDYLWIKNFVVIFTIVILLMTLFIMQWQHGIINYIFKQEENNIVENQAGISKALLHAIFFTELSEGVEVLSEEQLKDTIKLAFNNKAGETALFQENKLISGTYFEKDSIDSQLLEQEISENECILRYYNVSDTHYIKAVSAIVLQGQEYKIITTTDISRLYQYEKKLLKRIERVCIPSGIFIAVIFLVFFYFVLGPLKKINESIHMIVAGDYMRYLKLKRNDEIGQLADNINKVMETVNDSVRSLKEAVSQQKSFIDDLSHEMNTPLTSIICYSEIMLEAEHLPREKLMDYTGIILSEGKHLKMISEKLTDFIYIGKIRECDKVEISIKQTIDDICDTMTPMFEKKRVYFAKKIQDFSMRVDLELFKTMIYNYLDNAINVSKENDIVEISVYQTDAENIIEISDHGLNISQEDIHKIEESLNTADRSYDRKEGRSRLGLALSKKIAAAHDGEAIIFSELHKGTTIKIIFQQNRGIGV